MFEDIGSYLVHKEQMKSTYLLFLRINILSLSLCFILQGQMEVEKEKLELLQLGLARNLARSIMQEGSMD